MPASVIHQLLTRTAIRFLPPFFPCPDLLCERYCLLPDLAQAGDRDASACCFSIGGIPFHYAPDTPYAPSYRYYTPYNPDGNGPRRTVTFTNPHFDFMVRGIRMYTERFRQAVMLGQHDQAMRLSGVLLHVLQDGSFGPHCFEGPGGTDVLFFDRLNLCDESPFQRLASLLPPPPPQTARAATVLGETTDEAALRIYQSFLAAINAARRNGIRILLRPDDPEPLTEMFSDALLLSMDTLATLFHLVQEHPPATFRTIPLDEIPFYEPPWGMSTRSQTPDGDAFFFDSGPEQHLFFQTPPGLVAEVRGRIALADPAPDARVTLEFLENDSTRFSVPLSFERPDHSFSVKNPMEKWGFRLVSDRNKEKIALRNASLVLNPEPPNFPAAKETGGSVPDPDVSASR